MSLQGISRVEEQGLYYCSSQLPTPRDRACKNYFIVGSVGTLASSGRSKLLAQKLSALTPRETDVLRLIGIGATNRQIAEKLYISEATVKTHVTHLLNRLNMKNRSQLAIYAHSVFGKAEKL